MEPVVQAGHGLDQWGPLVGPETVHTVPVRRSQSHLWLPSAQQAGRPAGWLAGWLTGSLSTLARAATGRNVTGANSWLARTDRYQRRPISRPDSAATPRRLPPSPAG